MSVCTATVTCEATVGSPTSWNISIFGLNELQAKEMRNCRPEFKKRSMSASPDILVVEGMSALDANVELQKCVNATFDALGNRPEAILTLAAKYINALENRFKYYVYNTTADYIEGKSKWTFTLQNQAKPLPDASTEAEMKSVSGGNN